MLFCEELLVLEAWPIMSGEDLLLFYGLAGMSISNMAEVFVII